MNLEIITLSEGNQEEDSKYHIIPLICGVYKKMIQINLFAKQSERHRCRERTYGHQGRKRGREEAGD